MKQLVALAIAMSEPEQLQSDLGLPPAVTVSLKPDQ